ncbi:G1 family glutamic endopeptidase [Caldivirga sp. UBA161]|uniref:G1 family glutamic endopeptidase n=1 Tax=Caldivirga sp. UBA161 TaxID=1915569 RepID=UPI0025BAD7AC|nr:G1 family glutamic endopeptidase [Caldivirga sp. UBA161]
MKSRLIILGASALALMLLILTLTSSATKPIVISHPMIKQSSTSFTSSVYSLNWAGYAVPAKEGTVTSVAGSFIVPSVTCTEQTTYVALWVGLDGYNDSTVEQAGILGECEHGEAHYYVWYEFYPSAAVFLSSMTAAPGDKVYINVTHISGDYFKINITIIPIKGKVESSILGGSVSGADLSSAECILERPMVNGHLSTLANFGEAYYGQDYTNILNTCYATIGGVTGPFGSFSSVVSITMVNYNGKVLASPSSLTPDGSSFIVTYG